MTDPTAVQGEGDIGPAIDYALVEQIRLAVNTKIENWEAGKGSLAPDDLKQMAQNLIMRELEAHGLSSASAGKIMTGEDEQEISRAVMSRMFGMGRVESLLDIEDAEDIYVCGAGPVVVKYFGGRKVQLPPIAESDDDLIAQVSAIATHHGQNERPVTTARPFVNLDLPGKDARLGLIFNVTPHPIVTIRRHRFVNVQLEHLVQWGTISRPMMAFLQAAVIGRRSILVVGPQSAGKTTMLRALCSCIGPDERFATLETEYELLLHTIPDRFPLIIPVQERVGSGDLDGAGRAAGQIDISTVFPWTLRHSLERVIVGEVRSEELISMLRAMSRGYRGSMATFHADSAKETFESMASLLIEYQPSLTHDAAMRQIATALDIIVFIDREAGIDAETGLPSELRYVTDILEVGEVAEQGQPSVGEVFTPHPDLNIQELDPRGYPTGHGLQNELWARRAGLDMAWLTTPELGAWSKPFLLRELA